MRTLVQLGRRVALSAFAAMVAVGMAGCSSGALTDSGVLPSTVPSDSKRAAVTPSAVVVNDRHAALLGDASPGSESDTFTAELYLPLFTPGAVVWGVGLDDRRKPVDVCRIALRDESDTTIAGRCEVEYFAPKENGDLRGVVLLMKDSPSGYDYRVTMHPMRKAEQSEWVRVADPTLYSLGRLEPSEVEK